MSNLYPFKFEGIYLEKVWGGSRIRDILGKDAPAGKPVGESWEVSQEGEHVSVVSNGELKGKSLADLVSGFGEDLLGRFYKDTEAFPLLVKFVDADEWLSVQVHPDDEKAREMNAAPNGKTECWYILHADEGAEIVHNLKPGISTAEFAELVKADKTAEGLNREKVKTGDFFYLPSGMVHATGPGILLLEVQQSCDVTFRLYDWDRGGLDGKPRPLHVEQALKCTDDSIDERGPHPITKAGEYLYQRNLRLDCEYYRIEEWQFDHDITLAEDLNTFTILYILDGEADLLYGSPLPSSEAVSKGEIVLVPAALGEYELKTQTPVRVISVTGKEGLA